MNTHGKFGFNVQSFIQFEILLGVRVINRVNFVITTLFIVLIATNFKRKRS